MRHHQNLRWMLKQARRTNISGRSALTSWRAGATSSSGDTSERCERNEQAICHRDAAHAIRCYHPNLQADAAEVWRAILHAWTAQAGAAEMLYMVQVSECTCNTSGTERCEQVARSTRIYGRFALASASACGNNISSLSRELMFLPDIVQIFS